MRAWAAGLDGRADRIEGGRELQQIAATLRGPYIQWIADLGHGRTDVGWWSSRLAERNTYVCPVFRNLCYLHLALTHLKDGTGPLLIVSDSGPLLTTIARQPELAGRVRWVGRLDVAGQWMWWRLRLAAVWCRFVGRVLSDKRAARRSGPVRPLFAESGGRRVLMHLCIDEESLEKNSGTTDRYLTVLPEELRRRGCEVAVLPWLSNLSRTRAAAYRTLRAAPHPCVIPEDYYTVGDYMWAAWTVFSQLWLAPGPLVFQGRRIDPLVRESNVIAAGETELTRFVLYARLIPRLKARGVRFDLFIDKFENMVTEKPQVMALREHMPEVRTIGFEHYLAPYPLQLHMFTTADESKTAPHPETIVYNSRFAAALFTREGFPADKARVGPSLRYLHLLDETTGAAGGRAVLVMVPLDEGIAAELITALGDAFPRPGGPRFLLKVHPMMKAAAWSRLWANRALPHMTIAPPAMADAIAAAGCAIVAPGTTTGFELLLAGVPVIVVGRENDLDLNPLSWLGDVAEIVHSAAELRGATTALVGNLDERAARVRKWARQHRDECLSPLTDDTIAVFLGAPATVVSSSGLPA